MKITIYLFAGLILTSCSTTITLINKTNSELSMISVLSVDERSDLNFGYAEIKQKNILTENLKPEGKVKIQKEDNVGIVAKENYDYYFINKTNRKKIIIDSSLMVETEDLVAMMEPDIIKVKVKNLSKYYINEIKLVVQDRKCGPNKIRYIDALEFWRIIKPDSAVDLKYDYYAPCPFTLKEIIVKGYNGDNEFEKTFSSNMDSIEILSE